MLTLSISLFFSAPVPIATSSTMFGNASTIRVPEVKMARPIITLFSSSVDERTSEAGMSEAQKKAASIKASLANPFEMVRQWLR